MKAKIYQELPFQPGRDRELIGMEISGKDREVYCHTEDGRNTGCLKVDEMTLSAKGIVFVGFVADGDTFQKAIWNCVIVAD